MQYKSKYLSHLSNVKKCLFFNNNSTFPPLHKGNYGNFFWGKGQFNGCGGRILALYDCRVVGYGSYTTTQHTHRNTYMIKNDCTYRRLIAEQV